MPKNNTTFTILSSHGSIIADKKTGEVKKVQSHSTEGELDDIIIFNVTEYRDQYGKVHDQIDILDIGYTLKGGQYAEPDEEFRNGQLFEKDYSVEFNAVITECVHVTARCPNIAEERAKEIMAEMVKNKKLRPDQFETKYITQM